MFFTDKCVSRTNTFANGSIISPVLFLDCFLVFREACSLTPRPPSLALTPPTWLSGAGSQGPSTERSQAAVSVAAPSFPRRRHLSSISTEMPCFSGGDKLFSKSILKFKLYVLH